MNRIFKVVWNKSLQRFVVASELAKGAKKERTHNARKKPKNNAMLTMLASTGLLLSQGAYSSDNNLNLHLLAPEHQVMSSIVYLAADNLGDTFPDRSDVVPFAANSKEAPVLINNDDISSQNRERIQYSINNYQGTGYFNLIIVDYDINQPLINPGKTALTISTTQTATNTNTGVGAIRRLSLL